MPRTVKCMFSKSRFGALLLAAFTVVTNVAIAHANPDSIAVIIGNRDYGNRVPPVAYALNDADAMKSFVIDRLGYRLENVIYLENATLGRLQEVFGDDRDPKGTLWDWVRPGRSDVFVFYSGHGAPGLASKQAYLIPTDVDPEKAERGYPLQVLQRNLARVKKRIGANRSLVFMLDACFSGQSAGGPLQSISAGIIPKIPVPQAQIMRIAASRANQVANWDHDRKQGLLTAKFLDGIAGAADKDGFGNNDGHVVWSELATYVEEEVRYRARRAFGRDQNVELTKTAKLDWRFSAKETPAELARRACAQEPARWNAIKSRASLDEAQSALSTFSCTTVLADARQTINGWREAKRSDDARKTREKLEAERVENARQQLLREQREAIEREMASLRAERRRLEEERRERQRQQEERESQSNSNNLANSNNQASLGNSFGPTPNADGYFEPSFNCYVDTDPDEQAVCRSAVLSELDVQMGRIYKRLRSQLSRSRRRSLRNSQRNWIKQRQRCGSSENCLEHAYRTRINALGG